LCNREKEPKVPFTATQLNTTERPVELCRYKWGLGSQTLHKFLLVDSLGNGKIATHRYEHGNDDVIT